MAPQTVMPKQECDARGASNPKTVNSDQNEYAWATVKYQTWRIIRY